MLMCMIQRDKADSSREKKLVAAQVIIGIPFFFFFKLKICNPGFDNLLLHPFTVVLINLHALWFKFQCFCSSANGLN